MLQSIIDEQGFENVKAQVYDINDANIGEHYGFISCTVTLMFIEPTHVDAVIAECDDMIEEYGLDRDEVREVLVADMFGGKVPTGKGAAV